MARRVRRPSSSDSEDKPKAAAPKAVAPRAVAPKAVAPKAEAPKAKPEAKPKAEVKAKADPKRPEGAPPAEDVMQEYRTSTHHVYKLKNHKKVTIPLK